jgi:glycerol-3-phosphate O-acyltransferase
MSDSVLFSPSRWLPTLLRKAFDGWVRAQVFPQPLAIDLSKPTCYVLARPSITDGAMLDSLTRRLALPPSHRAMPGTENTERDAYFHLRDSMFLRPGAALRATPERLTRLIDRINANTLDDVQLVPLSVFWGRTPEREESFFNPTTRMRWLRVWAAEGWGGRSRLRKLFAIVFFRNDVIVKFGDALSLKNTLIAAQAEGLTHELTARRIARVLRTQFRNEREAAIGPDLSHRRILMEAILREPRVRTAIANEVNAKKTSEYKVEARAEKIVREIAADYSYPIVRVFARILKSVWNRIYDGVEVVGADQLHTLAKDHTIVYVPCHRSHIDYLLLSYVVREAGLTIPHIAAGANLNLPIIGRILRGGGAFFLRRSFKDDDLYGEVFSAYVHEMLKRGFPVEYFVEGGRSRTGRMLPPKAGLISMTVQSFLREHDRPLAFVPVYIGYEKLIEGGSYTQELSGAAKKKESIWGLAGAVLEMRKQKYGRVGVTFARPIYLQELLDEVGSPDFAKWLDDKSLRRHTLTELSRRLAERINGAAHINPVSLVASALLATPKHAADLMQLDETMERFKRLIPRTQLVQQITLTPHSNGSIFEYCEKLGYVEKRAHALGNVALTKEAEAVSLTYFRNNVLHCFALPGLIACLVMQYGTIGRGKLAALSRELYSLLAHELYLPPWEGDAFAPFDATLAAMIDDGWLSAEGDASVVSAPPQGTDASLRVESLAAIMRPTLTRHALMLAIVVREPAGTQTREAIESLSQQAAQHLAMTHLFDAPEFSDKTQFKSAFEALLDGGLVKIDSAKSVHYDQALVLRANDAAFLLPPDTRAAVLRAARVREATTTGVT